MTAQYDNPLEVSGFPRDIPDQELGFLQRLHPGLPLPELREHLLKWYTALMALDTHKYRCVRELFFLTTTVNQNSAYHEAMSQKLKGGWWIDIGSGFGQDVRFPVLDGWPANRMLATDIVPDLWNASLEMYPNPDNITFLQANVLDKDPSAERLEKYKGSVEVVSLNLVLHTLGRQQVSSMLDACAGLLRPSGLILGACVGSPEPRPWSEYVAERWLHSPASLHAVLESAGFKDVRAELTDLARVSMEPPADDKLLISFSARAP